MANEINLKIKVGDDGTLNIVAKEAKKAAKATDELGRSTDRVSKSRSKYHKAEKGVGQAGLSSAKSFSKMNQTIGSGSSGLVGAYAVLAANIFALTAAFGALQRAAQVQQLEEGLRSMGAASGVAMGNLARGLQETTGHALSLADAMRATALASSAGFDSSSIERLGDVARKASIALGRDTADSLNRLTKGAIKLEPELLDELGIMVRLDEATQNYARQLGKSADDLTTFQKRQAFMNAVLEEGERKFAAMGNVPTNPFDKLSATFQDLTKNLLNLLNNAILPVVGFFANSQAALLGAMILFGKGIVTSMIPALQDLSGKFALARAAAAEAAIGMAANIKHYDGGSKAVRKFVEGLQGAAPTQEGLNKALSGANKSLARNASDLDKLTNAEEQNSGAISRKTALLKESQKTVNTLGKASFELASANLAEGDSSAVAAAGQGNYKEALRLTKDQFAGYTKATETAKKGTTGLTKATIIFKGAAGKAALAARVLGTAFLTMIPIIGQIIAAIGILTSVFSSLNEKFKSQEAKDYEELLKNVKERAEELGLTFQEVEKYNQGQESSITSVAQKYSALSQAFKTLNDDFDALVESGEAERNLFQEFFVGGGEYLGILNQIVQEQPEFRDQLAEIAQQSGMTTHVINSLKNGVEGLQGIMNRSAKTILSSFLPSVRKFPDAMTNMTKTVESSSDAIADFVNAETMRTSVDEVLGAFTEIENSFKDFESMTTEQAQKAFEGFADTASDELKGTINLDGIYAKNADITGIYYEGIVEGIHAAIKAEKDRLKLRQKEERLSKVRMATAKAEIGFLKTRGLVEGTAVAILEQQQKIRDEQVSSLDRQITDVERLISLGIDEEDNLEKKTMLERQRTLLLNQKLTAEEKAVAKAQEAVKIEDDRQKIERASLDVLQKRIDLLQREAKAQETIALNAIKAANRADPRNRGNAEVSAAQKYEAIYQKVQEDGKTIAQKQIEAVNEEFRIKEKMIDLEFTLLKLRLEVLKAEAAETAKKRGEVFDDTGINQIINDLPGLQASAKSVLAIEKTAALSEIEEARLQALADVKKQYREGGQTDSGVNSSNEAAAVLQAGTPTVSTTGEDPNTTTGGNADEPTALDKIARTKTELQGLMETASTLGPGGELINAVAGGALSIADAWTVAGNSITGSIDTLEEGAAVATAASQTFSQIGSIMAAASQAKVAGIDKEIAAEKKRDGKSKESLAKIKALEKKKENIQRKNFEMQKKLQMASIIADTAAAIMKNMGQTGIFGLPLVPMIAAMGAAQLAVVASQSFQGGGSSIEGAGAPSTVSIGKRRSTSDLSQSRSARGELAYFRGDQGVGGPENFRPAFGGRKHYATGGNMGYVVGEQGPELFMPERPGTIVPADDTAAAMGGNTNVTFSINAIDASGVEEVLAQQQGNIIGMIRTAANSYGEEFMEDLDETTYTTPVARRA
ncbi:MAG: hypothetical protein CMA64_03990 [Euryarchaeota archaeon]|nr:hypothetical protein [Euryarchaeota archaeon]